MMKIAGNAGGLSVSQGFQESGERKICSNDYHDLYSRLYILRRRFRQRSVLLRSCVPVQLFLEKHFWRFWSRGRAFR